MADTRKAERRWLSAPPLSGIISQPCGRISRFDRNAIWILGLGIKDARDSNALYLISTLINRMTPFNNVFMVAVQAPIHSLHAFYFSQPVVPRHRHSGPCRFGTFGATPTRQNLNLSTLHRPS